MNGNGHTHPARSVDFLSRLHDGELDASERARFEAHRAHCGECRRAAVEFEDALSLFRSTRSNPPRSDLAARILRKVQTTHPPRKPFSRRFQIDLGWAALLLTALFAILIMTPTLVRQRPVDRGNGRFILVTPPPPPAVAAERPAESEAALPRQKTRRVEAGSAAAPSEARPSAPSDGRDGRVAGATAVEDEAKLDRPEPPAVARREAPATLAAPPQPAGAGGEGDASARVAAAAARLHFSVSEIDGFGAPPALVSREGIELPSSVRGREYVLVVDSQGTVRQVSPVSSRDSAAPPAVRERPVARAESAVPASLSRLQFAPGNRPRRLLVRID